MLTLLNISNVALIENLRVEFEPGLNLLTGETGSGKSIIVDALGLLVGGRFTADMLKSGTDRAFVEGLFLVSRNADLESKLTAAGLQFDDERPSNEGDSQHDRQPGRDARRESEQRPLELIIRRELSSAGRSKIFINNHLATNALLRELRPFLVDIHGQGDQQTLFDPATHLELLDEFAGSRALREKVASRFQEWALVRDELDSLNRGEAEKLQMADILRFQIQELQKAALEEGEDERLEEERRRLTNVEKLKTLGSESFELIYEDGDSALTRIKQATRRIQELSDYDSNLRGYLEGLESAQATLDDLALTLRDFNDALEFSPDRLADVESRLADLARIKRKYGGSVQSAIEHFSESENRLRDIEHRDEREAELRNQVEAALEKYIASASELHQERIKWSKKFERAVEQELSEVAMERATFDVRISSPEALSEHRGAEVERRFRSTGFDDVEFYFSANKGEPAKPLARVASGGEASRLMLVLKTIAGATEFPRTIVFDEIDSGIGGRVSDAVGAKLKRLSETNQVLCVTHQAQIARFATAHHAVEKHESGKKTVVEIHKLDSRGRVEEIARMLTGSEITDTARRHAKELLKS